MWPKRLHVALLVAALLVSAVVIVVSRGSSPVRSASSAPRPVHPHATSSTAVLGPPWPAEVSQHRVPHDSSGSCDQVRKSGIFMDPAQGWPYTLKALANGSPEIAMVTVVGQTSWWHKPDAGHDPGFRYGLTPMTATNFHVDQTIKGSLPQYVQIQEVGAPPSARFPCWPWAWQSINNPVTQTGRRYVLFLQGVTGDGVATAAFGAADRFEIRNGLVYSSRDLDPQADVSFTMTPESLDRFVARVKGD